MYPPRDCRFRYPKNYGRLGVGQLLARDEHRHITIGGLEAGDGMFDPDCIIEITAVRLAR